MKANAQTVERIVRKYASAESVDHSLQLLRKLGKASGALTHREAAELVYLACGTVDDTRARHAVAMERSNTAAGTVVATLERQLRSGHYVELDSMPTAMLREVSKQFSKQNDKSRSNVSTPGFLDGKHIQVRGGATTDWTRHASGYVIEIDTP